VDSISEQFGDQIGPKLGTRRASHVESWADLSDEAREWIHNHRAWMIDFLEAIDPNLFWADMLPVGGPVLGPFRDYDKAIAAERLWLYENNLPVPQWRRGSTSS